MSFEEKSTWIMLILVSVIYGWYFSRVFADVVDQSVAVRDIAYRGLLVATVVLLIILAVVTHIIAAVGSPRDANSVDERDREINRFGEYVGGYALAVAALGGLSLALVEVDHFWIANAILAGLVLSEMVSGVTKLVLYRRGI